MNVQQLLLKLGLDTSKFSGGIVDAETKVNKLTKSTQGLANALRGGLMAGGLTNIFGIVDGVTDAVGRLMDRAKDLGHFWGAFLVGGEEAVRTTRTTEQEAEAAWEKGKKMRAERLSVAEARANLEKTVRDIKFSEASAEQQIKMLEKERLKLWMEVLNTAPETAANYEALNKLALKENEIRKTKTKLNAIALAQADEEVKKTQHLLALIADKEKRIKDLGGNLRNSNLPTVDDIAATPGPLQNSAKEIRDLQNQAKQLRTQGDVEGAKKIEDKLYGWTERTKDRWSGMSDLDKRIYGPTKDKFLPKDIHHPGLIDRLDTKTPINDPAIQTLKEIKSIMSDLQKAGFKVQEPP